CEVLQAAHTEGIVHRDLKPANLMVVDPDTPYEKMKVMDFGLAKLVDPPSIKRVTDTGMDFAVGTPSYICPEQVRGEEMDPPGDRPQSARDLAERYETARAQEEASRELAVPEAANPELEPPEGAAVPTAPAVDEASDPSSVVHQLEAWIPEKIAAYKLRGFVS